jgi:hypothetical protein
MYLYAYCSNLLHHFYKFSLVFNIPHSCFCTAVLNINSELMKPTLALIFVA